MRSTTARVFGVRQIFLDEPAAATEYKWLQEARGAEITIFNGGILGCSIKIIKSPGGILSISLG